MPVNKTILIEHLNQEVYCRLGLSSIHGIGVFALKRIPRGVNPLKSYLRYREVELSHEDLKALPKGVRKQMETFCYYDEKTISVPTIGLNSFDLAWYMNHSKTPNVRMKEKSDKFETLRVIALDEELTIDYDECYGDVHVFRRPVQS